MDTRENSSGTPLVLTPESSEPKKKTLMAVVAYILFFVPLLTDAKHDPFVMYHVRQGFVLFIANALVYIVGYFPVFGPFYFVIGLLHVAVLVLFVFGVVHAIGGKEKPLPLIGQFASKINL